MLKLQTWILCWYVIWIAVLERTVRAKRAGGCSIPEFYNGLTGDLYRPKKIPENSTCIWKISSKASSILASDTEALLVFKSLYLTPEDRLSVVDGEGHVILGPYAGNQVPFSLLTNTSEFSVVVSTSPDINYKRVLWAFLNMKDRSYNHMITKSRNMIESPSYRTVTGSDRLVEVKYTLLSPSTEEMVAISFDQFNLKGRSYLKVSGFQDRNENIYRTVNPPDMIVSFKSGSYLALYLDISEEGQGFRIFVELISAACSRERRLNESHPQLTISFDANSWTFRPEKPMSCRQIVRCPEGYFLRLDVLDAKLTRNALGMFAMKDGSQSGRNLLIVTDDNVDNIRGEVVMSSGPSLWLFYTSTLTALDKSQMTVNVTIQRHGGFFRDSGNLSYLADKKTSAMKSENVIFLLEVNRTDDILVTVFPTAGAENGSSLPNISIYDGHNTLASLLENFTSLHSQHDILVPSSKAMVVIGNFSHGHSFRGVFHSVPKAKALTYTNIKKNTNENDCNILLASPDKSQSLPMTKDSLLIQVLLISLAFVLGLVIATTVHCIKRRVVRRRRMSRRNYLGGNIKTVQWKTESTEASDLFID